MTTPTKKAPAIEKMVDSLLPEGSLGRLGSIKSDQCVWCSGPATTFRDTISEREYRISGMCQVCQDKTFGTKNIDWDVSNEDCESLCHQCGSDGGDEDLKVTGQGVALCPTCYAQEKHEYESD